MTHNTAHTSQRHFRPVPIPPITSDPTSVTEAVKALTEGYETISRQRGDKGSWLVTFTDLVELGLVTEQQANEHIAKRRGI